MEVMGRTRLLGNCVATRDGTSNVWWEGPGSRECIRKVNYREPYAYEGEAEESSGEADEDSVCWSSIMRGLVVMNGEIVQCGPHCI